MNVQIEYPTPMPASAHIATQPVVPPLRRRGWRELIRRWLP